MSDISSITVSGIAAAAGRTQESALTVASASATATLPATDGNGATAGAASPGAAPAFQPDARFAASYGLLSGPDIDLAGEVIEHLISSTSLIAIAQVFRADTKMIESLLDIKV